MIESRYEGKVDVEEVHHQYQREKAVTEPWLGPQHYTPGSWRAREHDLLFGLILYKCISCTRRLIHGSPRLGLEALTVVVAAGSEGCLRARTHNLLIHLRALE